jgi:hypothetical protein
MKVLAIALAIGSVAVASETFTPRLYHLTTETGMPHLEENLRYSITHETRCLAREQLATVFPVLEHASLKGCRLNEEGAAEGGELSYALICEGGHGTTGHATWALGQHQLTGTLNVKLGGKNMTFYQRVTAVPVGECEATR